MRSYFNKFLLGFALMFAAGRLPAQDQATNILLPAGWQQGFKVTLRDELHHPDISWPAGHISYRLNFGANGIAPDGLRIKDARSGKDLIFQLSEKELKKGLLQRAILHLITDLPYNSDRSFIISAGKTPISEAGITITQTSETITLDNGVIRISLPASEQAKNIAPVVSYGRPQSLLGHGQLNLKPLKLKVEALAKGPVYAGYVLNYDFAGGKHYRVNIRLVKGMEFAELDEQMSGFNSRDSLAWQMVWDGLRADHRYCPNRGDQYLDTRLGLKGGFTNIRWEPMEGNTPDPASDKHPNMPFDQQNQKGGLLPFRLSPYDNWLSWWRLPTAAFWSKKQQITIGLFINDAARWNNYKYDLWNSKSDLSITFHWKQHVLDYSFPLVNGTRSTCLAAYDHQKDIELVNQTNRSLLYVDFLRRWYGWIPLDKVKNWKLSDSSAVPAQAVYFKQENLNGMTAASLEQNLSNEISTLATGSERVTGPTPVGTRTFHENIVPGLDVLSPGMTPAQYKKLKGWYLFMNGVFMDEALMPMRTMLSGHPNFLADIKGVPGLTAFLYPGHPEAARFADHFEKFVNLNFHYHIRPSVPAWGARGGRWTENISTYTWAALKPTVRTSALLHNFYDGRNRLLQPGVSLLGDWLLNCLTSPVAAQDNRRGYLPQGAHSNVYGNLPPDILRQFAQELTYYDPLLAEHLFWATTANDKPFEGHPEHKSAWADVLKTRWANNNGTNPHLVSAKYTGYGFILRSKFNTPDEMFVNLQQIDEGPNYRWGRAAQGGNGVIYYFAGGKRYSFNGNEDVGDGPFGDVERITNFGIKKRPGYRAIGPYRSVGRNDLSEPLYDFGIAQLATVNAGAQAAPEYISRSVLQSESDYIVVFDKVADPQTDGRFSWFVKTEDEFPQIFQLKPGAAAIDAAIKPSVSNYHKDPAVLPTKGRYYDGKGSFLTLVSHKKSVNAVATAYGCTVQLDGGRRDYVFRDSAPVDYQEESRSFTGTAGIIQQYSNGRYAAALFEGSRIGVPGALILLPQKAAAGISLETTVNGFSGRFQSLKPEPVTFQFKTKRTFYLDGLPLPGETLKDGSLLINMPAGHHQWQYSNTGVIPEPAQVGSTIVSSHSVKIGWQPVNGALSYQLQVSRDGGQHWENTASPVRENTIELTGLTNGQKIHVRLIAQGKGGSAVAGDDYPVYPTDQVPHAPEGLLVDITGPKSQLSWGGILGVGSYRLYRREKHATDTIYHLIYNGAARCYSDVKEPGRIFEYAVSAVNGNGESAKSTVSDNDPKRFLNWQPIPGEGFRRDIENHENGFSEFNPFVEDQLKRLSYPVIPEHK